MSLYQPPVFAPADRAAVARLMHDHPFATLVTPASPEPVITHLPLLLQPSCEPHGTLIGHFARGNAKHKGITDLTGGTGHCDTNGGFCHY